MVQSLYREFMEKFKNSDPEVNLYYIIDRDLTINENIKYNKMKGLKFYNITKDVEWKNIYTI